MNNFDITKIKQDFPIFNTNPDLVYLDSAATSQKPQLVINSVKNFYEQHNANIHRGIYALSQDATERFESARRKVAEFIGAKDPREIIFTSNASEAINLVAYGWARKFLKKGDLIVTTEMEHHSNIVPWQRLKEEKGIEIVFLPIDENYRLNYKKLTDLALDLKRIRLITFCHASNVLGTINPIKEILDFLKINNIQSKVLIDAAQSAPHMDINVHNLGCDFLAFSSHKMLGPSGVGILYAKAELLGEMDPLFVGSHMIKSVTKEKATWADIPDKFETGTRNLEGVSGLGTAIEYLQQIGMENIQKHDQELTDYVLTILKHFSDVKLYGPKNGEQRLGVFSFNIANIHAHDVAEILNRSHIAVRSGHHCAQTIMGRIHEPATVRASLYLYNTKEDIDKLAEGIEKVKKMFRI